MLKLVAAAIAMILILKNPSTAANAVQGALRTWYESVAPAMFPFLLLTPMLTCRESMRAYERIFGKILPKLFRLPGSAAPAIAIGMIAGSPAGAIVAAGSGLDSKTRERVACCVCGPSAGFLVAGIGERMLGSAEKGAVLLMAQVIAQIALLFATRGKNTPRESTSFPEKKDSNAAMILISVAANMAAYALAAALIAKTIGTPAVQTAILPVLDLPSGAKALAEANLPERVKFMLIAAACGWSGMCIIHQNLAACPMRRIRFMITRTISAAVMLLLAPILEKMAGNAMRSPDFFAISALAAAIFAVPALIGIGNTLFLNKQKSAKKTAKSGRKPEKPQHDVL